MRFLRVHQRFKHRCTKLRHQFLLLRAGFKHLVHLVHSVHLHFHALGTHKNKFVCRGLAECAWFFHLDEEAIASQAAAIPPSTPLY
jgi:hypothetical protein